MLHLRDTTLGPLGDRSPPYTITAATDAPVDPDDMEPIEGVARQITGTFTVPNFLTRDGGPGNGFHYLADTAAEPDALPSVNGFLEAPFSCNIPDAVMAGTAPARLALYGHGLLGSETEIDAGNVRDFGNAHNTVFCATKWAGMSNDDIPNAIASLEDLSNFPTLADRLQQGILNQLVLARLLLAADGLTADPAFRRPGRQRPRRSDDAGLRRQQPGRDHGHGPGRGVDRHRPVRARRRRAWTTGCCCPGRSTSTASRPCSSRPTRTISTGRCCWR